ncbi:MAG: class beta-lactamase-related serine hydrolase [Sediminibacterium sp.]|nr:class beta-lactamase-related serine hydrolase [Sediminibacterium sp.]
MKKGPLLSRIIPSIFILIISSVSQAQTWQDTVALIDKVFNRYTDANPGAQLAISRNGQVIYSAAHGIADLEHNIPITKTTKIEAGSVSKQFTAACILLLEQQGKLSLSDNIRKYVPEVPDYGYTITIRHLMNHVSGIKDWGSIAELGGWPRGTRAYANSDALHIISLQKTLNNKPGDEYIYSNSGYNLLAIIIQRVSGSSLAVFSKNNLFEPAGMKNTEWRDDYQRVVPNRAIAYGKGSKGYYTNMPNENVYGNGGLLTTAEDLLAWNNYYLNGKLGSPSLLSKQLTITPFNNGKRHTYAAGLIVDSLNGWPSVTHSGSTAGYRANLDHFPQQGLSIAWVSNTGQSDMSDIPSAIRNLFVKNPRPPARNTNVPPVIDLSNFTSYLGTYREAKTGNGMKLFTKENALFIQPKVKLIPLTNNSVALGRARLVFAAGTAYFISGVDTTVYTSVPAPDLADLNQYAGTYASDETESKMNIVVKNGKLLIEQREDETLPLTPIYKNGFSFPGGDAFFETDKNGKVSKIFVSISRARMVEFKKI